MCRAGGTPAGRQPKLAHARLWLWETLTGGLPRQAPPALRLDHPEFLPDHYRFPLGLPATTVRPLNQHARRLLDTHGCRARAAHLVTPPPTASRSINCPAPDPDAIDPHSRPRRHRQTAHTATRRRSQLGITARAPALHRPQAPPELHDPTARPHPHASDSPPCSDADQLQPAPRARQIAATDRGLHRNRPTDAARRTHRPQHPRPTEEPPPVTPPAPADGLSIYPRPQPTPQRR